MGGKKAPKNTGNKPKQDTSSPVTVTQVTETRNEEKSTSSVTESPGEKKLRLQRERDEREAKEEKERKKAAEEKAKQEAKNNSTKKKAKKTPPRAQNVSEPKPESKPVKLKRQEDVSDSANNVPEVQTQRNTSGNWNIHDHPNTESTVIHKRENQGQAIDSEPHSETKAELDNWETDNSNQKYTNFEPRNSDSTAKRSWGKRKDSYQNRDNSWEGISNQNDNTSSSEQQSQIDQSPTYYSGSNWRNSNHSNSREQRRSYNDENYHQGRNYSGGDNNSNHSGAKTRLSEPNYNQPDSYSQFSNRSSNYNRSGSWPNFKKFDGKNDEEFQQFLYLANQRTPINNGKLTEIKGDLFTASEDYSLAHCVAEDMSMGAGIAKTFRSLFGHVGNLLNQRQKTGGLAILAMETRYIYYLVTKQVSRGKPTMYTLWMSVQKLKQHIQDNNVTKLAIPQIGCGLDRLDWRTVQQMLEYVFKDIDIEIVVYIWDENAEETPTPQTKLLRKCAVVHVQMKLTEIQKGTGLVYFGSVDGHETEEFKSLADKFNISASYRAAKALTDVIKVIDKREYIYGLIIKKSFDDCIDYEVLEQTLKNFSKELKKDQTVYISFQAFLDKKEDFIVEKIIALMQYIFLNIEIWICWPDNLKNFCPQQNKPYEKNY